MLTNFRKSTALLLSVAVVCATVALVPQTAGAAASKAPAAGTATDPYSAPALTTAMKACPGTAAAAAGFTDTTSTDVDCIKMYGVTTGKTATTYDPTGTISRQDMARFIHRMFVPTGMTAAGLTAVPAFTDTAHVTADGLAAISALASHGITTGTTATTFSPDDNVTREQMALFLYRFAQIVGTYDDATPSGITMNILTKKYNYSDIATVGFESMESIIGLYNAGVTGETCISTTVTTCGTTYRPTEDITRAEMASMLTALLGHTNARPAGVSIQTTTAVTATTEATSISCRNADFTVNQNVLVDSFQQVRTDTTAATIAAAAPFVAVTNVVNSATMGGTGTVGTMDTGDKLCGVKGNVAGTALAMTADSTGRWWAWTAAQGTIYVDGATTAFLFEASVAAGAATTWATTATHAWDNAYATATNFGGTITNVTATDGSDTYQGTSRVLTTTLTGASTAAVVDGYTVKYVDKVVSYGGGTGNQTVVYNTTYVASSAGKTSLTVACSADPRPTTDNAAAPGTITALEYYESHEVTISFATAAGGTGLAVGSGTPDGTASLMNNSTMNLSCDDVVRAYPGADAAGSETLSVGKNYADVATAGTLASITATAYDQYGVGIAGITAQFDSVTATNTALTAISVAGAANRSTLTTGADGTATLTAVVCTANGYVSWALNAAGTMDAKIAAVPAATVVEGTVIYCVTPGTDTVTVDTANTNVATGVTEVQTIIVQTAAGAACDNAVVAGDFIITYNGEAGDEMEHDADATDAAARVNSNANLTGVAATVTGGHTFQFTFLADTGNHPALVPAVDTAMNTAADGSGTACTKFSVTETTKGVSGTTFDFVDDDLTNNSFVTIKTVADRTANPANLAVVTTNYQRWTYDSTDTFAVGTALANQGQTEAGFETANAAISNLTTNVALTYRTGATSTGQSHFSVGN
jgi:hypothetical protein